MFTLLERKPVISDHPNARSLDAGAGQIRFDHVSFSYTDERTILDDVSFEIPARSKTAVVGPSGSGKSTIVRLLFRFYDVTGGCISVNGQDIRNVTQHSLRSVIGVVPQDTVLFNNSIYYNIAYGRPDATRDEVIEAARQANLAGFISELPQAYDTMVGERGLKVSGGEKQRIAIARMLLKQPRIMVFDEATSSLDSASEQVILGEIAKIASNHTSLVIAHRLSTIVDADNILVLDHGKIVEQGNHTDLLQHDGIYAGMWELQQKEAYYETPVLVTGT